MGYKDKASGSKTGIAAHVLSWLTNEIYKQQVIYGTYFTIDQTY